MGENVKITITQDEISALKKLIMYIKFSCDDIESLEYSGSYSINSFFDKIIDADYIGQYEKEFYKERNLDNEMVIIKKIENYQDKLGIKIEQDIFENMLKENLHPFTLG